MGRCVHFFLGRSRSRRPASQRAHFGALSSSSFALLSVEASRLLEARRHILNQGSEKIFFKHSRKAIRSAQRERSVFDVEKESRKSRSVVVRTEVRQCLSRSRRGETVFAPRKHSLQPASHQAAVFSGAESLKVGKRYCYRSRLRLGHYVSRRSSCTELQVAWKEL